MDNPDNCGFFFGGWIGFCADVAKIGVVEFQRLFENSDAGKEIKAEITTQGKKMEAELKEKGAEIEELKKRSSAKPW
jgi:outer membrane protein